MKNQILINNLKNILYQTGYHVILISDTQLKNLAGISEHFSQDRGVVKGLFLPDRFEIIINQSLSEKEKVLTLIHELIHIDKPQLNENIVEKTTFRVFKRLSSRELGFFEFAVSHMS